MKADLYTAEARTAGADGLAHRTVAGFVVLTSADGDDMIALIEDKQNEPNVIDQVAAKAQASGPGAFAMLFTAGGDLYVLASGTVGITLVSPSTQLTMQPLEGQILVHALTAGVNESNAVVRLHLDAIADDASADAGLQAGTVEASWVEIAVGEAKLSPATASDSASTASEPAPVEAAPEAAPAQPAPAEAPPAEPAPVKVPPAAAEPAPVDAPPAEAPPAQPAPVEAPPAEAPAEPAPVEAPPAAVEPADAASEPAPTETPTAETPPAAAEPEAAPASVASAAAAPAAAAAVAQPAATSSANVAAAPAAKVGPVMVLGVSCAQGHHNHPDAVYCSQCGTKMGVHHTTVLINGPRPPLGVLVVDDGTTYSLNEDLVIGREPTSHSDVVAGTASPMILTDDTLSLSRQHARIVLDDWTVSVQDLQSSNGTYISRAGQNEAWAQLDAGATMMLEPGDQLRVGGRIIQVELHHVR